MGTLRCPNTQDRKFPLHIGRLLIFSECGQPTRWYAVSEIQHSRIVIQPHPRRIQLPPPLPQQLQIQPVQKLVFPSWPVLHHPQALGPIECLPNKRKQKEEIVELSARFIWRCERLTVGIGRTETHSHRISPSYCDEISTSVHVYMLNTFILATYEPWDLLQSIDFSHNYQLNCPGLLLSIPVAPWVPWDARTPKIINFPYT